MSASKYYFPVNTKSMSTNESVLDDFLCTHEENTEQFANFFTMLTSEDKKALIHKEDALNVVNVNKADNENEYRNTPRSKHTYTSSLLMEHVNKICKDVECKNDENNSMWIEADECNTHLYDNYKKENEHISDEMEAVELTEEYGKEVYTGGLANCITCDAIDIVPSYDNYMNIDDRKNNHVIFNGDDTNNDINGARNGTEEEYVFNTFPSAEKRHCSLLSADKVHTKENELFTEDSMTALLLDTIAESCDCLNTNKAHHSENKVIGCNDNDERYTERECDNFADAATNSTETHAVHSNELEEINTRESAESCCSLNSSIALPGIDDELQESVLDENIHSNRQQHLREDKDKITEINAECHDTVKDAATRDWTEEELTKLKSIVKENDDCVHAFYSYDGCRFDTLLEETKICQEIGTHINFSANVNSHVCDDALGNALRHHTFIERV